MIRIELPDRQDGEDIVTALEVAAELLPPPTGPRMSALAEQVGRSLRALPPAPTKEVP